MDQDGFSSPAPLCAAGAPVRWSAALEEAVVARTREGVVLRRLCAEPGMPSYTAVQKRTRERPAFAAAMREAREAAGLNLRGGARSSWCAETGEAICVRLCQGEAMVSILRDPAMPGYSTFYKWVKDVPEFRAAVGLAREIQGQRLAELGWEAACEATPETAFVTKVKLEQLRWYAGKLSPRKYGPLRPVEPEDERPAERMTVIVKSFRDITPEDEAEHDETERRLGGW